MPASTAPEAKRRILALIAARPALATVQPRWTPPTEGEDVSDDVVAFGDVELEGEWRVLGAAVRDEAYTIGLSVFSRRYGDDEAQATEERSWALLDEVSAALASDKHLGGLLKSAVEIVAAVQSTGVVSPSQWGSRIDAQLRCEARFTP